MTAMQLIESVVQAAEPFKKFYDHSKVLSIGTTYLHIAAMLGAGGLALSADKQTLSLDRTDPAAVARHVAAQQDLHRWVVGGLTLSLVTGLIMFASDVETFWKSAWYWRKIVFVVLLLGNGLLLQRAERAASNDPADVKAVGRLRMSAVASVVLWFVTALLGVIVKTEA